jgi:hypothetical protein
MANETERLFDDDNDQEEDIIDIEGDTSQDQTGGIVEPVDDLDAVADAYERYEEVKNELLIAEQDAVTISGDWFITKSGWRKIATAFNVSVETVSVESQINNGIVKYTVSARAIAPNDKYTSGTGICASNESNFSRKLVDANAGREEAEERADSSDNVVFIDGMYRELPTLKEVDHHNIMATAETRAKNRAISDLVGGGEISGEEMAAQKKQQILEE